MQRLSFVGKAPRGSDGAMEVQVQWFYCELHAHTQCHNMTSERYFQTIALRL